jgi:hypothetical protein
MNLKLKYLVQEFQLLLFGMVLIKLYIMVDGAGPLQVE